MPDLWIASANAKKRRELERILAPLAVALHTPDELGHPFAPVEDAADFAGNARLKATALARLVGAPALGDDSGLCVDALQGRPGVHSARYGGPGLDDRGRLSLLLRELTSVEPPRRTAHFVCSLCLCGPGGDVRAAFEERCDGILLQEPAGEGGFGYDPVFVPLELAARGAAGTFARLDAATKDRLSHRGKALRRLVAALERNPELLA
jgi:XTP/dITP diphosphohydrolase